MFNVAVLKMKDIKKYGLVSVIIMIVGVMIFKYFPQVNQRIRIEKTMLGCLEQTVPSMANINQENKEIQKKDVLQGILKTQISSIQEIENLSKEEGEEETEQKQEETKEQEVEMAKTELATEVITQNPIKENYTTEYGSVKIKNETDYELTQSMLTPDITIENKNIILFHTHSCESYTSSDAYSYTPTGSYRTTDLNYTVTRVGTELENQLKQYQYQVNHSTSYHDYPAYNGSYTRSLETVETILKETPADIIMDVHRDAIGSRSDYAPIVKIGDEVAAQIMFVIRN